MRFNMNLDWKMTQVIHIQEHKYQHDAEEKGADY